MVRPEDARGPDVHPGNRLSGTVVARAFQGRCWRLTIELGAPRIRLDWPEGLPIGATIEFSLPPEQCTIIAS